MSMTPTRVILAAVQGIPEDLPSWTATALAVQIMT